MIFNLIRAIEGNGGLEENIFTGEKYLRGLNVQSIRFEGENQISKSLRGLLAFAEACPDLKASENFLDFQKSLDEVEENIQKSRDQYNRYVGKLNTHVNPFPPILLPENSNLQNKTVLHWGWQPSGSSRKEVFQFSKFQKVNPKSKRHLKFLKSLFRIKAPKGLRRQAIVPKKINHTIILSFCLYMLFTVWSPLYAEEKTKQEPAPEPVTISDPSIPVDELELLVKPLTADMEINIGPLLAVVGTAGFAIAFALQGTLSNFASGLMIMFYKPFDVGDVIEVSGLVGIVKSMSLVNTTITKFDNQVMIVPNNSIWGNTIANITDSEQRRVDLVFGISYSDDIDQAQKILEDIVSEHPLVLDEPESTIKIDELADSSVNFICRPWVKTTDSGPVRWDIIRAVKERFDQAGISIPFPQRDIRIYNTTPTSGVASSEAETKKTIEYQLQDGAAGTAKATADV